jgi:hypothetical protein
MPMRRRARGNREPGHGARTQPSVVIQTGGSDPETRRSRPVTTEEIDSFTMRLVGRYGSTEAALTHIAGEQLKYRRRAQDAEARAEELEGQLPTSEDVVLKGDEAKAFKAIKTGNDKFTLVGLGDQLKELGELRSNSTKTKRSEELKTAAGSKYRLSLLSKLLGDMPLQFKPKLVPKADDPNETEEIQMPFVKVGDTLMSLDSWLDQEHKDLLDALTIAEGEQESGSTNSSTTEREPAKGTVTMPKQTAATGTKGGPKGKDKDLLAVIDKSLSTHMSPGQLRKAEVGK